MTHVPTEVLKEFVQLSDVELKGNLASLDGDKIPEDLPSPLKSEGNTSDMQLTHSEFPCNSSADDNSKKSSPVTPDLEQQPQERFASDEKSSKRPKLDSELEENLKPEAKTSTPALNGTFKTEMNSTPKAFNSSLLLGKSSNSVSLTPKLPPSEQSKKSPVTTVPPKSPSPNPLNTTQFSSSVSLTVKIPNSSLSKETPLVPTKSLAKEPASPETLSDLEKKIVGSVSISPKIIEKEKKVDDVDDINNDEELLCPSSPFSDTSSHISLSLEESLLRDEDVIFNESKPSEDDKKFEVLDKTKNEESSKDQTGGIKSTIKEVEASENTDSQIEGSEKNSKASLDKVKETKNKVNESLSNKPSDELSPQSSASKTEDETEEVILSDKGKISSALKLSGSLDDDSKHSTSNGTTVSAQGDGDKVSGSDKEMSGESAQRVGRKDSTSSSDARSPANLEMDVSGEDSGSSSSHGVKSKGNDSSSSSSRSSLSSSSSNKSKNSIKKHGQSLSNQSTLEKMSKESSQTEVPKKNKLDNSTESKDTKLSKSANQTKPSGVALTFTEALKSMEAEEDALYHLKNKPEPLKPTVELSSSELETSTEKKSLTVLETVSHSIPSSAQSLKRSISQVTNNGRPKADLKKIRVFDNSNKETSNQENGSEASSRMLVDMEQCLRDDKALQSSDDANRIPMDDVNPEELRRRTVMELENSKTKSLSKLKRIRRKDLESLVTELFVEKVLYEHELGQQRDLCKRLEATLETNRKKAAQFHKEVEDLKKVTQRLQAEHIARKGQVVAPVKVKRSVGIQATPNIIGKGLMHASSANNNSIKLMAPTSNSTTLSPSSSPPPATNQVRKSTPTNPQLSPTPTPSESTNSSFCTKVTQTRPYIRPKEIPHESSNVENQGGKFRPLLPSRNVVINTSQTTTSPVQSNTNVGSMVVLNSPQQVMVSQGGVASMTQLNTTTRFVRGPVTNVVAAPPLNNQVIGQQVVNTTVPASKVAVASPSGSGFIDLTDDEEAPKNTRLTASTGVLVPRSATGITTLAATTNSTGQQQYVAFQQVQHSPTVSQLVLLPNSSGSATLLVGNMAANGQTIVSGSPTSVMRPNILSANGTRLANAGTSTGNIINAPTTTRVVVASQQMNGGTMLQSIAPLRHPAPLPRAPPQQTSGISKKLPPVPILKLSHKDNSIVLSWNMNKTEEHEDISSYQLFAYQEGTAAPAPSLWKKVGSVKALELPMACTLTQFMPGHVYHFAVRAVDARCRTGPFSEAKSIRLGKLA